MAYQLQVFITLSITIHSFSAVSCDRVSSVCLEVWLTQKDCSAHLASSMMWASSSGLKSFLILRYFLTSSTDLPLILEAVLAQTS